MENENREMEKFLDSIGQQIMCEETTPGILNPIRFQQIQFAHRVLEQLTEGSDMKVTYQLHRPFNGMGSICVEGEDIIFPNCKWLARAIKFASNVDIYPLSNEKLRFVLTFHGLTKGIK